MPYRVCRSYRFEAARQLSASQTPMSGSYTVDVVLAAKCLDAEQTVLPFSEVDGMVGRTLDAWNYSLLAKGSPGDSTVCSDGVAKSVEVFVADPTLEILATILHTQLAPKVAKLAGSNGLRLERVRVTKLGTGWAEYSRSVEKT